MKPPISLFLPKLIPGLKNVTISQPFSLLPWSLSSAPAPVQLCPSYTLVRKTGHSILGSYYISAMSLDPIILIVLAAAVFTATPQFTVATTLRRIGLGDHLRDLHLTDYAIHV